MVFVGKADGGGCGRAGAETLCQLGQVTYYSATSPVAPTLCRLRLGKRYDFPFQYNLGGGRAG